MVFLVEIDSKKIEIVFTFIHFYGSLLMDCFCGPCLISVSKTNRILPYLTLETK